MNKAIRLKDVSKIEGRHLHTASTQQIIKLCNGFALDLDILFVSSDYEIIYLVVSCSHYRGAER